ncbi:hypothetical protein [Streptomyces sp. NPDC047829]|uniref:hypothetical protein n=1 Tax=Streptomyces sp. NPDC047829 TaxID=3154609 RepID=UPI00340D9DD7
MARSPPASPLRLSPPLSAARTDVGQTLSPDSPQDLADLEAAAESYGYGYHSQQPTRASWPT